MIAKKEKNVGGPENDTTSAERGFSPGRRQALIVGSLLVPTIVTLHGTPAWAQTDYTMTAYRYGDNAGKCRNPHYNPNADIDGNGCVNLSDLAELLGHYGEGCP